MADLICVWVMGRMGLPSVCLKSLPDGMGLKPDSREKARATVPVCEVAHELLARSL